MYPKKLIFKLACSKLVLTTLLAAQGTPGTEIKIDFTRLDTLTLHCGNPTGVLPSGFSDAQKKAVIDEVNAMLKKAGLDDKIIAKDKDASGPSRLSTQCIDMVVSGTDPGFAGDKGMPGEPGMVFSGGFEDRGYFGEGLENGVAETVLHEAGHKLGLHHNWGYPPNVMMVGRKKTYEDRANKSCLSPEDIKLLQENCEKNAEQPTGSEGTDAGVDGGASGSSSFLDTPFPTDDYFSARAYVISGDPLTKFGFLNDSGQFIFVGDASNTPTQPTYMTFPHDAGVDFAIEIDSIPYALSTGDASYSLGIPTPSSPELYHELTLTFTTNTSDVVVQLDASGFPEDQNTRGFFDYAGNGVHAWADQGNALAGTHGDPMLTGGGMLYRGSIDNSITLTNARENALASVVVGSQYDGSALFGGVLVPTNDLGIFTVTTDASGTWSNTFPVASTATLGLRAWWQVWIEDPAAPMGFAASNGLRSTVN